MKYMLQIYGNVTRDQVAAMSEDEQKRLWADWGAISQTQGVTPAPFELDDPASATTIRVENGQTLVTDGPFAQTKEALGGWLLYEAEDLDAAIELASRIPTARMGGAIEVRPVVQR
jgi:hypothetical protein